VTLEILDIDVIGMVVGALLTVAVLSYLLGDNPFYRLALHLFVGALVGYSFGVVLRDVVNEMVIAQVPYDPLVVIPLTLGMMLVFKFFPKRAYIGNFPVAFLVGVGTAVALGGALLGTLVPQIRATGRAVSDSSVASFRLGVRDGLLIIVGTVCTLMAFTFAAQKRQGLAGVWSGVVRVMGGIGRGFLIIAFGVAFAGALTASLSIFIGRIQYIIDLIGLFGSMLGG
jgi:hypothetical protein